MEIEEDKVGEKSVGKEVGGWARGLFLRPKMIENSPYNLSPSPLTECRREGTCQDGMN